MKDEKRFVHSKVNATVTSAEESWKGTKVDKKVLLIAQGQDEAAEGQSQQSQSRD
jgi:hypothetical protein